MKKTVSLIIFAILIMLPLVGCSNRAPSDINEAGDFSGSFETSSNAEGVATDSAKVDVNKISQITDFSNGLAFLEYENDDRLYCIDKNGNQIFALENCNIVQDPKFNKKIAMIRKANGCILCDKKGKIYTAEDFGASSICMYLGPFLDGYIVLEREEESYKGTKVEMSIMDSDFTTLVPFSTKLASTIKENHFDYYDGYFYNEDIILDLRTGSTLSKKEEMNVSPALLSYWSKGSYATDSKWKHLKGGDIYNAITLEVVAKAEESEEISSVDFVGDVGLAFYYSDHIYWFNVITKDGKSRFQPIKGTPYTHDIEFDGETILVSYTGTFEKDGKTIHGISLKTYNTDGNLLGEQFFDGDGVSGNVRLNEGVITVYDRNTKKTTIFNKELKELF